MKTLFEQAVAILGDLVDLFWRGLFQQPGPELIIELFLDL